MHGSAIQRPNFIRIEANSPLWGLFQDWLKGQDPAGASALLQGAQPAEIAGAVGLGLSTQLAIKLVTFRNECLKYYKMVEGGAFWNLTHAQLELAKRYGQIDWNTKMAFVSWLPYGALAIGLAPTTLLTLADDAQVTLQRLDDHFEGRVQYDEQIWESYNGSQTARYDSKVVRGVATALGVIGAVATVAAVPPSGGTTAPAALVLVSGLLNSAAMGSAAYGIAAGGVYGGAAAQQLSKQGMRIWHKFKTGLPLKALKQLAETDSDVKVKIIAQICEKMSLHYFKSPYLQWLNLLRIRVRTGDTNPASKSWVRTKGHLPDEAKLPVSAGSVYFHTVEDGQAYTYRVDPCFRAYKGSGGVIGAAVGATLGFLFLGPIGAVLGGLAGHSVGSALGSRLGHCPKPTEQVNAYNPEVDPEQALNQALQAKLNYVHYKQSRLNVISHYWKVYFRNGYENTKASSESGRKLLAAAKGLAAIVVDLILLPFKALLIYGTNLKAGCIDLGREVVSAVRMLLNPWQTLQNARSNFNEYLDNRKQRLETAKRRGTLHWQRTKEVAKGLLYGAKCLFAPVVFVVKKVVGIVLIPAVKVFTDLSATYKKKVEKYGKQERELKKLMALQTELAAARLQQATEQRSAQVGSEKRVEQVASGVEVSPAAVAAKKDAEALGSDPAGEVRIEIDETVDDAGGERAPSHNPRPLALNCVATAYLEHLKELYPEVKEVAPEGIDNAASGKVNDADQDDLRGLPSSAEVAEVSTAPQLQPESPPPFPENSTPSKNILDKFYDGVSEKYHNVHRFFGTEKSEGRREADARRHQNKIQTAKHLQQQYTLYRPSLESSQAEAVAVGVAVVHGDFAHSADGSSVDRGLV